MEKIELQANAKINLTLDVLRKRGDGYHELKMIMQTVSLFDNISIRKTDGNIRLKTNLRYLPTDKRNIAYGAAELFLEKAGIKSGLDINIKKTIPVAAGLAGGSTDAATVLVGLNRLFGKFFTEKELLEMGGMLGSDVPFCIRGGCALCEGRGEVLTPMPDLPTTAFLIVKPPVRVSTAAVYGALQADKITERPDTDGMIAAISRGDREAVAVRMFNVLETVTAKEHPEIELIKREMIELGAVGSVMSGSGPTVIGLFTDVKAANDACSMMRKNRRETFVASTLPANTDI